MNRRLISILLLSALLITTGCGASGGNTGDTTAPTGGTTTAEPADTEVISAALPAKDYGGYEFKMLTTDKDSAGYKVFELDAESLNGDVMNDAVFKRNTLVEETYNITLTQIKDASNVSKFTSSVLAADDAYDVLVADTTSILKNSYQYGLAVDELPYVDLDKPWWDTLLMEGTALGGVNYLLTGDINLADDDCLWVLFFNKRLAEEFKLGDLYQMVWDGKWTIDALKTAASGVTYDLNGDSVLDYHDRWGLIGSSNFACSMLWSGNGKLSELQKDSTLAIELDTNRNMDILEKVFDLFSAKDTVLVIDRDIPSSVEGMTNWNYSYQIFKEGRALFYGYCFYALSNFRDMEDEFGYLPCPKYDEKQDGYTSIAQEWVASALLVPKSASDPERTSIILEAMASSAMRITTPAYYDTVLTRKYSRDDESEAIIDLLRERRTFDLAYAYNFGSVRNIAKTLIADSNTIASTIATLKDAVQAAYETTYKDITSAE